MQESLYILLNVDNFLAVLLRTCYEFIFRPDRRKELSNYTFCMFLEQNALLFYRFHDKIILLNFGIIHADLLKIQSELHVNNLL
jgi:hypothetical protein